MVFIRNLVGTLLAELEDEATAETVNAWGNDDLMDVNADEGDWSAFESAEPAPAPSWASSSTNSCRTSTPTMKYSLPASTLSVIISRTWLLYSNPEDLSP